MTAVFGPIGAGMVGNWAKPRPPIWVQYGDKCPADEPKSARASAWIAPRRSGFESP